MVFDKTWSMIQKDFDRLNPFTSTETESYLGKNRGLDTLDNFGDGIAGGKYDIDQYTYPLNLMEANNRANAPYMMIYINEREQRYIQRGGKKSEIVDIDETDPTNGKRFNAAKVLGSENPKNAMLGTSVVLTTALAAGAGGLLGGAAGAGTAAKSAGVVAGAVVYHGTENIDFTASTKRLKAAIALHMPNQLDIRYGSNYKNDAAAAFVGATKIGGSLGEVTSITAAGISGESAVGLAGKILEEGKKNANSVGMNVALQLLPGGDTISNAIGLAPNPMIQSVFEGVEPRTFSIAYNFFPKNKAELENIYNIITLLKSHMLPTLKKSSENFLFIYPSEFDICYYVGAEINKYIHKHAKCVLMNLSLNYTPNSQFNYLAGEARGAPIQIDVRMDFRELDVITSEDIANGY